MSGASSDNARMRLIRVLTAGLLLSASADAAAIKPDIAERAPVSRVVRAFGDFHASFLEADPVERLEMINHLAVSARDRSASNCLSSKAILETLAVPTENLEAHSDSLDRRHGVGSGPVAAAMRDAVWKIAEGNSALRARILAAVNFDGAKPSAMDAEAAVKPAVAMPPASSFEPPDYDPAVNDRSRYGRSRSISPRRMGMFRSLLDDFSREAVGMNLGIARLVAETLFKSRPGTLQQLKDMGNLTAEDAVALLGNQPMDHAAGEALGRRLQANLIAITSLGVYGYQTRIWTQKLPSFEWFRAQLARTQLQPRSLMVVVNKFGDYKNWFDSRAGLAAILASTDPTDAAINARAWYFLGLSNLRLVMGPELTKKLFAEWDRMHGRNYRNVLPPGV